MKGPGCIKAVENLIKNIGAIKEKKLTREHYEKDEIKTQAKQKIKK